MADRPYDVEAANAGQYPYVAPPPVQPVTQPKLSNEQFITNTYNQYLGRPPSPDEISRQIQEGTQRLESQDQWLKRVTAGATPVRPAPTQPTPFTPQAVQTARSAYNAYLANQPRGHSEMGQYQGDPNALTAWTDIQNQLRQNARIIPGAMRPDVGYVPGFGAIDLGTMTPFDWLDPKKRRGGGLTPVEQSLTNFFSQRPDINMPRWEDVRGKFMPSGRGYSYAGAPSAREQQLVQAGVITPQTVQEYASLVGPRIRANKPSAMQQFASKYYAPALMAVGGAMLGGAPGLAGVLAPAAWGAFTAGAQSRWDNPAAVGAGAAGGALGGYGGQAAGGAMGLGAAGTGAMQGAGAALGRNVASQAVTGQYNPYQMLRDVGIGGAVGAGVGGLQTLGRGGVINTPGEPGGAVTVPPAVNPNLIRAVTPALAHTAGTTMNYYLPGRAEPTNPYAAQQQAAQRAAQLRAEDMARRRRMALARRR